MADKIRFKKGDVDDYYVPSDSEDEYTEKEKSLLAKTRRKPVKDLDNENEVYAFSESESDNEGHNADSDIEDEDAGIPDTRAWGKRGGAYYSTDYVDQDYGGFTGREEEVAEQEEMEARAIQERLAKQLDEADFTLDVFSKKLETEKEDREETIITTDLTGLSRRQKLQLFHKEAPEFTALTEDFKEKMEHLQNTLQPLMDHARNGDIPSCPALDFVSTQYHLVLNYCTNISFYLLLKSKRISVQNHPVVKRLNQYRQLLTQLQPTYDEVIEPQVQKILEMISKNQSLKAIDKETEQLENNSRKKLNKSKKLNLLKSLHNAEDNLQGEDAGSEMDSGSSVSEDEEVDEMEQPLKKKAKLDDSSSDTEEEQLDLEEMNIDNEAKRNGNEDGKRAITYQMSKNKGLTPFRKKELRNPRVKHRNKYRKAQIRRKGAVRVVRTETSRYGGELSGIKSSVRKSIKIK